MRKILSRFVLALILTSLLVVLFSFPHQLEVKRVEAFSPTQIIVPDDFSTIQEAINHANEGDTITVKTGTYYENVVVNKTLTIIGADKYNTVLTGNGKNSVVYVTADSTTISGFYIQNGGSDSGDSGIRLVSNTNNITNNIVASNRYHGICLKGSNGNIVSNNTVFLNRFCGIVLTNSDYNVVVYNNLTENLKNNNGVGIVVQDNSDHNIVKENTIIKNDGGIGISGSYNKVDCSWNTITNNRIFNNLHDGIFLYDVGKNNIVTLNEVTQNGGGIHLWNSDENVIVGNNVSHSSYGGIGFEGSTQNICHHNNLVENTPQVHFFSNNNVWDNGVEGNYWSDYNGTDNNGDSIGDTPYVIDENNQDNYPLMNPCNSEGTNVTMNLEPDPETWTVDDDSPADFDTIQEAINAAGDGDTVLVFAGTYYENVIVNKTLTVKSQSGPENTFVCNPNPETGKNVFEVWADNVEIRGFTIQDSTNRTVPGDPYNPASYVDACGIYVGPSTGTRIDTNIVKNNFDGVVFANCSNIIVLHNQVTENIHEGVRIVYSSSANIIWNNITSNHHPDLSAATGLVVFHCTNSEVTENRIIGNDNGVVVSNSQGITVSSNSINDNRFHGLNIVNGNGHEIFGNTIRNNTYGVCPSGGSNIQIYNNILQENDYGIAFYGSSNNFVYHNYFINNSLQVHNFNGHETNSFDDGYPSGGNYWSDYTGTDNDRDGIGDTPYIIDENNRDNYPLTNIGDPPVSIFYNLIVDSVPSGVTFTVNNATCTAPWSETYNETTHIWLVMPETYSFEGENYIWWRWSDGDTNRMRTITVDNSTMVLTAMFKPENTSLKFFVVSPENKTYSSTDVPLEISVNRIFFGTSYSLDGEANVTIVGNTTLTGLSEGPHNLIVYVEDTPGNISASSIVHFTVDTTPPNITKVNQLPLENNETLEGTRVDITVTDTVSGVEWVSLNYTNGNGTWINCEMTNLEGNVWSCTIPTFPHGTNITYIITVRDNAQNTITSDNLLGYPNEYEILPEFPSFLVLPLFMVATLIVVIIYQRRLKKRENPKF